MTKTLQSPWVVGRRGEGDPGRPVRDRDTGAIVGYVKGGYTGMSNFGRGPKVYYYFTEDGLRLDRWNPYMAAAACALWREWDKRRTAVEDDPR